jgi:hypothetical protein
MIAKWYRFVGCCFVGMLALGACSDGGKKLPVEASCLLNSDCNSPLVCSMGLCHTGCNETRDCLPGQSCVRTPSGSICQLPAEADCRTMSCGGGLICASDYRCRSVCQTVVDCNLGQVCVTSVCADTTDLDTSGQLPAKNPAWSDGGTGAPIADAGKKDTNLGAGGAAEAGLPVSTGGAGGAGGIDGGASQLGTDGAVSTGGSTGNRDAGMPDVGADAPADTTVQSDKPATTDAPADAGQGPEVSPIDGGGASPVPTGCGVASSTKRYFCDDFEAGLSKWVVSGQDWGLTELRARSSLYSLTDSPNGNYSAGAKNEATLAASVDLTAATAPVLTFWHQLNTTYNDGFLVQASSDGGTTWGKLAAYYSDSNSSTWTAQQLSLAAYKGKSVKIRFYFADFLESPSAQADGWYIDDVEIREVTSTFTTEVALAGCSDSLLSQRYFCDSFESGINNWVVSGQDWNTTTLRAHSQSHSLTDSPNGNFREGAINEATMVASVDLAAATAPVLTFWHQLYTTYNDYFFVLASPDGGTTWAELVHFTNTSNSTTWTSQQLSLAAYKGKTVKIRFYFDDYIESTSAQADGWYIDDVEIREAN